MDGLGLSPSESAQPSMPMTGWREEAQVTLASLGTRARMNQSENTPGWAATSANRETDEKEEATLAESTCKAAKTEVEDAVVLTNPNLQSCSTPPGNRP